MNLQNKVALITGSSRGIGKATAFLLAEKGAKIVVNYDKEASEAERVVEQIKKNGTEAIAVQCDVSDENQVKQMVNDVIKKFGRIDILVNNAGIVYDVPFLERTVEQWKRTLDVNLLGVFLCCKHIAPLMKKQKSGKIINVSSTNGMNNFSPEAMDYDASKAGVIIITRDLAKELAPYVQVNSVAPGWVDTDMNKDLPNDFVKEETDKIYLKRFAKPTEIANTIAFFASEEASYITGSTLRVDGGYG